MSVFQFLVVFKDGTKTVIDNVSSFGVLDDIRVVEITKNNQNSYFNLDEIKYFGFEFDLENEGSSRGY